MTPVKLAQVLLSVAGISTGQLLLKLAAMRMNADQGRALLQLVNAPLVAGIAVLGGSTLLWVWVLRSVPLSEAYPYMALCFVLVPLAGIVLLGEPVSWRQAAGTALVIAGVAIIGRG